MKTISINGSVRTEVGKKATNALRNAGLVPCCLYGVEKEAKSFCVPTEGLRKLVYTPDIHVVDLTIDGVTVKAIMKDIQFHPVKDTILHVDFYQVTEEKPIVMAVQRYLKVKALYTAIPEILTVDVTALALGKSIKVGELSYEGLELVSAKESLVCSVKTTRASAAAAAAARK